MIKVKTFECQELLINKNLCFIAGSDGRVLFASASQDQNVHIWGLTNNATETQVMLVLCIPPCICKRAV